MIFSHALSQSDAPIPVSQLREALYLTGTKLGLVEGTEDSWEALELSHDDPGAQGDSIIAKIDRNPVEADSLGEGEIAEFLEEIGTRKPESAARWLRDYLSSVKVVYCFQVMHHGAEWSNGWHALHTVQEEIREAHGGISQADYEGFSNDDGYHILWQFSDDVDGPWNMAVIAPEGEWTAFEMDLGNREHRKAFKAGKVPDGVKRL